jgi:predicted DNA-binding WGR domain protein
MNADDQRAEAVPCPAMDNLLCLAFEAHSVENNHHRHYAVTLGRDLLDHWTVAIRYGRTGQSGQERRYAAADPEAIQAIIRDRLRRRLSAPKRIGCPYRLAAFSAAPGFDANAWLPGDVMARFFQAA